MNARHSSLENIYASSPRIEEGVTPTAFAILPEYFIDKLSVEEREKRIESYKLAFADAKRKARTRPGIRLKGWFDLFDAGGGI